MSSGSCVRCGRTGEMEYGTDGMSYCSSCIFYGLNKQCVRCRMYLPGAELQQYRGQWTCPYCIQDMRDEDRRSEYHPEKPRLEALQLPEQCERCGRNLDGMVYIWNGKKLCRRCIEEEQEKWGLVGGGPGGAPQRITLERERTKRKVSFIEALIGDVLHLIGLKRKPRKVEIIEYQKKMPIQHAKPMAEKPMRREDVKPQSEGPMGLKKEVPRKIERPEREIELEREARPEEGQESAVRQGTEGAGEKQKRRARKKKR